MHAKPAGRSVDIHAYADRVIVQQGGEIVGEHTRRFGCDQVIYDPWHSRSANGPPCSAMRKMTTALLEWLTHHCDTVETGNESWRLKSREAA